MRTKNNEQRWCVYDIIIYMSLRSINTLPLDLPYSSPQRDAGRSCVNSKQTKTKLILKLSLKLYADCSKYYLQEVT